MNSEKGKKILTTLSKLAVNGVSQYITTKTGFDTSLAMEMFTHEKTNSVSQLKEDFSSLVDEIAADGRIVIFVDDLDRLSPEIAVELLEIMKLFMDVEKCVFVLAIDYGVVVKGVRAKYGKDMTDEKCRSFFDKIIQLPFRMPIENYTIDKLVKETFKGDIESDAIIDAVTDLLKDTLGMNPRTFKRLYNSFTLLRLVHDVNKKDEGSKLDEYGKFLLLASLVVQISSILASESLVSNKDEVGDMQSLLENPKVYLLRENNGDENTERKLTSEEMIAVQVLKKLNSTLEQVGKNFVNKNIYESFCDILSLTTITSIPKAEESKERKKAIQINKVVFHLNGVEKNVDVQTATEAAKRSIEYILENNNAYVEQILNKFANFLTTDKKKVDEKKYYFRANTELDFRHNDALVYLGTSTSTVMKFSQINSICQHLSLEKDAVVWMYEDEIVFSSDGKRR